MNSIFIFAAAIAAQQSPSDAPGDDIIVTASREPVEESDTAVSATLFKRERLDGLSLPFASDVLRLVPGVSVTVSGPRGSQTEVRIRGAEADHSLIFVDGIRFNDPAAGNAPRFELLTGDLLERIELVRGPQSALWGSEALGGVVAVESANPILGSRLGAVAEYGSLDSGRAAAQFAALSGDLGVGGSAAWSRSDGLDAFGDGGERDGFENRSASLKAIFSPGRSGEIGIVGHYVDGTSEFDGYDAGFKRANTLDATDNRIYAVRGWSSVRGPGWSLMLDGSYLHSRNRNRVDVTPLNSTFGNRFTLGAQLSRQLGNHMLTLAGEHESEGFKARDQLYSGGTNQDRSRSVSAAIAQWRASWSDLLTTELALRHDDFSAFEDATTVRGTALLRLARGWTVHGSYGEGIAQPTFYDLYGFFPGSFIGNPALRPESSKGWEAGIRWRSLKASLGVTAFTNALRSEIVPVFDSATFLGSTANALGKSRRQGIEMEGSYQLGSIRLDANYSYLDAQERKMPGEAALREARRPRHSANLFATGNVGAADIGAALSFVGKRRDTNFDLSPAEQVTLDDYLLASVKLGWRVSPALEAFARIENLFDADYEDAVGYRTAGRTIYAGIRLRPRR